MFTIFAMFCHHVHHMCPTHHIIPHIPHMCLTTPYYSSPSPYMSNHTILFLTRFPALNKSHGDSLVSYTSFLYGRIMSVCLTQSFPSGPRTSQTAFVMGRMSCPGPFHHGSSLSFRVSTLVFHNHTQSPALNVRWMRLPLVLWFAFARC